MILIDKIGHMVATESEEELHAFARKLGLKYRWYQSSRHPHYDLTTQRIINKAIIYGAELVTPFEIMRRAWWSKR